ncbi:MAG: ABC transporter permease subunit, partial [Azonexus sp.]
MLGSPILLNALLSWQLGIRSHALRALLVLGVVLMLLAFFAGAFSLRQPLVVAMDMGLSGLRFLGLMLVLFWMQEAFAKDIDRRTIAGALAYPAPRSAYVLGRFMGVVALIGLTVMVWGGGLYLMNQFADWGYDSSSINTFGIGFPIVLFGILLDLIVIGAFFVM